MTALADLHFLRPLWLLLLLAIPLFWLMRRRSRADAGAWRGVVDAHLLPHLIERIDAGSGRAGAVLAIALWTLTSLALAGPAWEREPMPLYRNQAARVLALELSATMLAQDEKPSRFERARYKLDDILERSRDYQTALIGYAGEAFVAAPLTDDVGTVRNLVDALDPSTMPVAGNRASRAIEQAQDLIRQAGLHSGDIVLLADSVDDDAVAAARKAHAQGLVVSVLGIGSTTGAPVPLSQGDFLKDDNGNVIVSRLDENSLRAVAEAGGGRYAALSADTRDIASLLVDRTGAAAKPGESGGDPLGESTRWRDRGPWLLVLVLPLAAFAFRRGWLMALAIAMLSPAPRAEAASLQDLWLRRDQQAAAALAEGDAKHAASVAGSPDWHGGASYRAGDYATAAADYAKTNGADGAYNEGNALAKLGRYDEALAAYDRALKLAPDMDDAKANKAAVEAWLKQQPKPQDKSSSQKKSKSGDSKDRQQGDKSQQNDQQDKKDSDPSSEEQKQGSDSEKSGEDSEQQQGDRSQSSGEPESQQDDKSGRQDSSSSGTQGDTHESETQDAPQQGQASAEQQQALSKAIDRSLASGKKADEKGKPVAAMPDEDDATQEKRQALEHLLQRVPDDPGGLLRRKFMLEYQRRQQRGGDAG